MPFINVYTSAPLPAESETEDFLKNLSKVLSKHLKKPEKYVMTCLLPWTQMTMGGKTENSCYVDIKSVGEITEDQTQAISSNICDVVSKTFDVDPTKIYIVFESVHPHLWGWNHKTFA